MELTAKQKRTIALIDELEGTGMNYSRRFDGRTLLSLKKRGLVITYKDDAAYRARLTPAGKEELQKGDAK